MSISQNFPSTRPSLNLNFAGSQRLDPRITFTRTSSATRVNGDGLIEVVPANSPRFDFDPISGECLGLLIEEQRQNLIVYNTKHDDANWVNVASSETINTTETLSPDGTYNATKLFGNNGATARQSIYQGVSVTSGTTYTFSVFIKQGQRRYATIWFDTPNVSPGAFFGAGTIIDLQTGTSATGTETTIVPYPNGWYRCYVTATPTATQSVNMNLSVGGPNNNNGVPYDATGDGSSGIYIWGHQVEVGSFVTSLIPTTTSTVTRTVDNASITGTNFSAFYNPSEWTLMVGARRNYAGNFIGFPNLARINDGTTNNYIAFYGADASNQFTNNSITSGGVSYTTYVARSIPTTTPFKMIQALKKDNSTFGVDGVMTTTDTSVEMPVGANQLLIGVGNWGGTIQQLVYYPTALPSNQLQTLTKYS